MNTYTADFGVAGTVHRPWTLHATAAAHAAAAARKHRATADPTLASVDRSFI